MVLQLIELVYFECVEGNKPYRGELMPIFEYYCSSCDYKFEELVQGDRDKKIPCPKCGTFSTEKLMSAIGSIAMGGSQSTPCGASGCPGAASCSSGGGCPNAG